MCDPRECKEILLSEDEFRSIDHNSIPLWSPYPITDPRSPYYRRILTRPKIKWGRITLFLLALVLLQLSAFLVVLRLGKGAALSILSMLSILLVVLFVYRRVIAVELIKIYQHYAPAHIRERCMFEPSCSDYMIAAIKKYGAFRGITRGIRRLRKCNPSGGGFDYP